MICIARYLDVSLLLLPLLRCIFLEQISRFCENCGALDHLRRDCVERPRKILLTQPGNFNLSAGKEKISKKVNYDKKRDHWASFDAGVGFERVLDTWEATEEISRSVPSSKPPAPLFRFDAPVKLDPVTEMKEDITRTNTANIRIREDRAGYLNDLDADASLYNPKSRRLHAEGDDFVKAGEGGGLVSQPTLAEKNEKMIKIKKEQEALRKRQQLELVYGEISRDVINVEPVETQKASVIQIEQKIVKSVKSDHSEIFGSFFNKSLQKWGFACCHKLDPLDPNCSAS